MMRLAGSVFVLLGLAQFWACPGADAYAINPLYGYNAYNPYTQAQQMEQKLLAMQQKFDDDLDDLEDIIELLARESCQTGRASIQNCDGFKETGQNDITLCVTEPLTGGIPPIIMDFTVPFDRPFVRRPVVEVSFNGQALLAGKNCTVEVAAVGRDMFTFTYTTDDFFAVASNITWFACPGPLLQPGESLSTLTGPRNTGLPNYKNYVQQSPYLNPLYG